MSGKYPVAYRKGASGYAPRLSNGGSTASDFSMERLFYDHLAQRTPLPADYAREGKTTPRLGRGSVPKNALRLLRRLPVGHPALKALQIMLDLADRDDAPVQKPYTVHHWAVPGYTKTRSCTLPPLTNGYDFNDQRFGIHPTVDCFGGQAVAASNCGTPSVLPTGWQSIQTCNYPLNFGLWVRRANPLVNYNPMEGWTRFPVAQILAHIARGAPFILAGMRSWNYQTDPFGVKSTIGAPALDPTVMSVGEFPSLVPVPYSVIPYRVTDELAAPSERTEFGPEPQTQTQPEPLEVHPNRRPHAGERERKTLVSRAVMQLVSAVTEAGDFVKAMYECLPKKTRQKVEREFYRGRRSDRVRNGKVVGQRGLREKIIGPRRKFGPAEKAAAIYKYAHEIPIGCALFNFIWNEVEDAAYAAISKNSKNPFSRQPGGGRSLQFSRQGDAELPHGKLPLDEAKKWLRNQLGV